MRDDGIVVFGGWARGVLMDVNRVPAPLMERLGGEATAGLLELLTEVKQEWTPT